ncbi:ShlB/FhaC/HecB family hemolysin secretion/activation protein [Arcobacter sp. CECT 9188]|uniref:ShlB/FhaC/HecB family hemolysin secretion/activation protein n=1 Tax=Arcobacter sp. CECT 9188 TaxID=2044505 RepID=UPI000DE8154C|nr:ShlB/FhaC/HecB family hemolysin secretion/activation protein [Arcobacter sp. CECT 9188]RBQ25945.1 hemin-binding protein [Arcobacter sp. CECT 9188]
MRNISKIITISVLSSVALLGASPHIPNSSTIDRQIEAPKDIPLHKKESINIQGVEVDSLKSYDSSKTVLISDFNFIGNSKISSDELKSALNEYVGKDLTFNQIQEVLAIVTKVYRDKGYFIARAYLQQQDINKNGGVLIISVVEGKYGEIKLNNSSLVKDSSLKAILDNAKSNDIIKIEDIQRALLLINDRAGVQVSSSLIEAGEVQGSSNLVVETLATPKVDGYVVLDNYGGRYTGLYRVQSLVNINSLATLGDKLSVSGLVSNGADLKNGRLAYEIPLNSYGLKGDVAYSRTNYNLVKEYKNLDAKGNSNIYEVGLSYPLLRTIDESLYLRAKYYHKNLNDYMLGDKSEDKNINSLVVSLNYEKNYYLGNYPSRLFSNLNLTTGHLKSISNKFNDETYNKVDIYLSNQIAFSNIFSFNQTLKAQKVLGNKNLDGSEDLSLGGAYDVKVYPDSEKSGENGYILNFELLSQLPNISSYNHKVGVFYDMGNVYQEINQDVTFNRKTLQDIGLGYYSSYKDFFAKVQMAWALNSDPISSEKTSHQNSKLLFQAGLVF